MSLASRRKKATVSNTANVPRENMLRRLHKNFALSSMSPTVFTPSEDPVGRVIANSRKKRNNSDSPYDIPRNDPTLLEMVINGIQTIKTYIAGFRRRAGTMWVKSCRAEKRNQRVKKSSGTELNPPIRSKGSSVREISSGNQIGKADGLNTENDVYDLECKQVLMQDGYSVCQKFQ